MSNVTIAAGTTEPLELNVAAAADGLPLTGSVNLRVQIRRSTDGFFLDFSDNTFKNSGWTTRQATLTEVSSSLEPGQYHYPGGVSTTGWSAVPHEVRFLEISTTLAAGAPVIGTGEIRIVAATAAELSGRIPPTLVGGRMDASVGAVAAGAIGASGFAADAITSTVLADNAITAAKLASNAITSSKIATDAIGAAQIAAGAITSTEAPALANLDAAVTTRLATASYTAPPTVAAIADAVLDEVVADHATAGTVGVALARLDAAITTRAVAGDAMTLGTDSITAAAVSAAAVAKIQSGLATTAALSSVASSVAALPSAAGVASAVWATALPGAFSSGQAGHLVGTYLDAAVSTRLATGGYTVPPTAAAIAGAVLDEPLISHTISGTPGQALGRIDVVLSTRAATGAAMALTSGERNSLSSVVGADLSSVHGSGSWATATGFAVAGDAMALTGGERTTLSSAINTALGTAHGSGSWATATGFAVAGSAMTLTTGERAAVADAVWDELLSGHATAGSAGAALSASSVDESAIATAVWAKAVGTPTSSTFGWYVQRMFQHDFNRQAISSNGTLTFYGDDASTPFATVAIVDVGGSAITVPSGSPARRAAAVFV